MRAIILLVYGLLLIGLAQVGLPTEALAQVGSSISADGSAPNDNAMLDVKSPSSGAGKGMLIPRVTVNQRTNANGSVEGGLLDNSGNLRGGAAQGLMVYQTDGTQGVYFNTSLITTPAWVYLGEETDPRWASASNAIVADIANRLASNVWAAAGSTTNYLPRTGGTMSGALNMGAQIVSNVAQIDFSGDGVSVGRGANGATEGAAVGFAANSLNNGVAMGWGATGANSGAAVGWMANGITIGAAVGYLADGSSSGAAVGREANGSSFGAAVGREANGSSGVAMGYLANGSDVGTAVGRWANGSSDGAAVGRSAKGTNFGVAVGYSANGPNFGVAVGYSANGRQTNVAIGAYANALGGTERIAIGYRTTNEVNGTAVIRGTLYLDGGTGVMTRATFGVGAWNAKTFEIDHPLDPENKVLRHYCMEGPQVWNVYAGNAQLVNGQAVVQLPDYYSALNLVGSEICSLTPWGRANVWVAQGVDHNTFSIAGDADVKVSWTVKVLRNDPGCREDLKRRPVEQRKSELDLPAVSRSTSGQAGIGLRDESRSTTCYSAKAIFATTFLRPPKSRLSERSGRRWEHEPLARMSCRTVTIGLFSLDQIDK